MDSGFLLVFLLFGVLVVVIAVFGYLQAKKRREEMAAYAASRGWRYEADQPLLVDRFQGPPFGRGDDRRAYNAVYGKDDGRDFVSFDYSYDETTGSGKDRHTTTYTHSVCALSMGVSLPSLTVDPENFFERFVGRLSGHDIELELEDFNRAFTVTSPDRKFASDVLHPRMMELMLQHRDIGWRFERDSMLMVSSGQRSVGEIDATLALMDQITDQVPDFVWRQVRGQGGTA